VIGEGTFVVHSSKSSGSCDRQALQNTIACLLHLVSIGDDCVISHGVMFINDLFSTGGPANGDRDLWKCTTLGNHISNRDQFDDSSVSICDWVVIGAGSSSPKTLLNREFTRKSGAAVAPLISKSEPEPALMYENTVVDLHAQYLTIKRKLTRRSRRSSLNLPLSRPQVDAFEQAWARTLE